MTAVTVSINGGAPSAVTLGTTTVSMNPGDTIQVFGTTGATVSAKYGVAITIGSSAAQDWFVTNSAAVASITTPAITSPPNGTTNLNPATNTPAGIPLVGDAYSAQNGAGAQTSSTWEVYNGGLAPATQSANSATAVASVIPTVGAAVGGGYFGGQISTAGNSVADYNLIVAPVSAGALSGTNTSGIRYKTTQSADSPTATVQNRVYGGPTTDLFKASAAHPVFSTFINGATGPNAGAFNLTTGGAGGGTGIGGFNDWYLPAENELEILYYNLKPNSTANFTGGTSSNPNAVPARASNYTAGTPARTTITLFQTGGAQAFSTAQYYWSSTEASSNAIQALQVSFSIGQQFPNSKDSTFGYTRAIRRVAVGTPLAQTITISAAATDGFALGQSVKGSVSNAVGIITAINGTSVTVDLVSGTFQVGDFLVGNGTAVTGSPFSVTSAPFTTVNIPQANLAVSSTYYARVKYATTNVTAATSSFSAWSSFGTASSFALTPGTAMQGGYFAG
jgi:hypothetical protein